MSNASTTTKEQISEHDAYIELESPHSITSIEDFSSNTIQDPLRKYKKLYFILAVFGLIIDYIATFTPFGALFFAFIGIILAWFIIQGVSLIRLLKMNWRDYPLPSSVTEKQLYEHLKNNFTHPEIEIEKGLIRGISFIFNKKTIHTVTLNEKDKIFSIHSKMSKMARVKRGGKENTAKVYIIASQIVPLLSKLIQDTVNSINENGNEG